MGERETAELREQFIAVLGHDLRTPLGAIQNGVSLLRLKHLDPAALPVLQRIERSVGSISNLVDDVVDFTRGRMGGGISLNMRHERALSNALEQVVSELREVHPGANIEARIAAGVSLLCDSARLAQLLSNLLKNAIVHGEHGTPVLGRGGRAGGAVHHCRQQSRYGTEKCVHRTAIQAILACAGGWRTRRAWPGTALLHK